MDPRLEPKIPGRNGRRITLADTLLERATKEQLAESAQLLALNVAHYQIKHGDIPLDETLAMIEPWNRAMSN